MWDEYEMTVTALRTLLERNQKLAMVCQLLEEEAKKMTMKPNVDTDTVTAFSSHRNHQQSN
jgi:hypothetical protein